MGAKFYKSYKNSTAVVICVRTEASITNFGVVQHFVSLNWDFL